MQNSPQVLPGAIQIQPSRGETRFHLGVRQSTPPAGLPQVKLPLFTFKTGNPKGIECEFEAKVFDRKNFSLE
ncbi:MAG: hypothetical protein DRR19_01295 [Candidatus Parabeggiatoa sp. nov. 1]|nr:MAG: hypothetical protein DRR19_01295 [Gammaproteobacteria bacterium]